MSKHLKHFVLVAALLVSAVPAWADFQGVLSNNLSGTVTAGGTFQSLAVQNVGRKGCTIVNPPNATETLFVFLGPIASATTGASVPLAAGASLNCALTGDGVAADQISVTATTPGHAFTALFQ